MKTLTKGQMVTVYQKPLTNQDMEGDATLICRVEDARDNDEVQNWKVKFRSDDFVCERLISVYECTLCKAGSDGSQHVCRNYPSL